MLIILTFAIAILIFIVMFRAVVLDMCDTILGRILATLFVLLVSSFAWFLLGLGLYGIGEAYTPSDFYSPRWAETTTSETELLSLSNSTRFDMEGYGSIFVGRVSGSDNDYYLIYVEQEGLGKSFRKYDATTTYIDDTWTGTPTLSVITKTTDDKGVFWWFGRRSATYVVLRVPDGTIKDIGRYEIDIE